MSLYRITARPHTVSRAVLRRFAWRGEISVFDREIDIVHAKGIKGVFVYPHFDAHDPEGSEARWREVEEKLTRVFKLVDEHKALDDSEAVGTLYDLLAMHWARSPATRVAHKVIAHQIVEASMAKYRDRADLLAPAFQKRTGLVASTPGELEWTNERLHRDAMEEHEEEWWSERNAIHFATAREMFARSEIQVGYAAGGDFMIGDAPVITRKEGHGGLGPHQGVAIGDAVEIAMPIGAETMIALGPESGEVILDRGSVERYNSLQYGSFHRWIGCRPGGAGDQKLRAETTARTVLPLR